MTELLSPRIAPSGEARCTGTVNLITNGFMQGGAFPSFLTDTSTVPGGGPCSSSPCTGATNKGGALSVVTEASLDSLYGLHSLSFVNSKGSAQFTTKQACLLSLTAWRRLRTMCSPSVHSAVPAAHAARHSVE